MEYKSGTLLITCRWLPPITHEISPTSGFITFSTFVWALTQRAMPQLTVYYASHTLPFSPLMTDARLLWKSFITFTFIKAREVCPCDQRMLMALKFRWKRGTLLLKYGNTIRTGHEVHWNHQIRNGRSCHHIYVCSTVSLSYLTHLKLHLFRCLT